jgi:hypothetical protein
MRTLERRLLMIGIAALPAFTLLGATSAQSAPSCTAESMVLACFDAYKTELRDFHTGQLDAIAKSVASASKSSPVRVALRGHAATFKSTDPTVELANTRAKNVKLELANRIKSHGGAISQVTIVTTGFADKKPVYDNNTQSGRALNRRVEIAIHTLPNPKPKRPSGQCKPNDKLVSALEAMTPTGPDQKRRKRVACLRDKLVTEFSCKGPIDDWYHVPSYTDLGKGVVRRFSEGRWAETGGVTKCAGKTGETLARCMNGIHDDMLVMPNKVGDFIMRYGGDIPPASIRLSEECARARKYMEKAKDPKSVYSCFKEVLDGNFYVCK